MRNYLLSICVLFHFAGNCQDSTANLAIKTQPKMHRHLLTVSPISPWLNTGFSLGHHINYQFLFKRGLTLELESNGTVFRRFDRQARSLLEDKVFPLLNQSNGILEKVLIGRGKTINRQKQKRFVTSVRVGYHFFQHASSYQNKEYWAYDSTVQDGFKIIRSFRSHSLSAGLGFKVHKYKRNDGQMSRVASHKWSLDYLRSVHYQLSSYSLNDDQQYDIQNIPNTFAVQKNGARLTYGYTRYLNSYFGIHAGVEVLLVPFLDDYTHTSEYFVPRGGRLSSLLFINANLGVTFTF